MKTVRMVVDQVECGDAEFDGITLSYARLLDAKRGQEVIAVLEESALVSLIEQLAAMRARQGPAS